LISFLDLVSVDPELALSVILLAQILFYLFSRKGKFRVMNLSHNSDKKKVFFPFIFHWKVQKEFGFEISLGKKFVVIIFKFQRYFSKIIFKSFLDFNLWFKTKFFWFFLSKLFCCWNWFKPKIKFLNFYFFDYF